jgi:hypothetical protein
VPTDRDPRATAPPDLTNETRYLVRIRLDELIMQLLRTDTKYNERLDVLRKQGAVEYHIDTDVILRNLGGTTKVLSDMIAAMSTYLLATRPRR